MAQTSPTYSHAQTQKIIEDFNRSANMKDYAGLDKYSIDELKSAANDTAWRHKDDQREISRRVREMEAQIGSHQSHATGTAFFFLLVLALANAAVIFQITNI